MLGKIATIRTDNWMTETSAALAVMTRGNSNVQVPYRVPIIPETHDDTCTNKDCLTRASTKRMCRQVHQAQKNIIGYFGGYCCKSQPVGKYELKKSTENVDYLKEKLEPRKLQAKHHLAHVVNRMFTTLETKGIARPATEEFMLSAEYNEHDPLSAEFIRTCDHYDFFGGAFLTRVESAMTSKSVFNQGGPLRCRVDNKCSLQSITCLCMLFGQSIPTAGTSRLMNFA